ncbi:type II toxin-antitoxin system Phd/YefM family antitoxin [Granulicella mallensis]|uniref:Antitoxin (DNA-binding transcriptional repressor) of toxin-antitoxin stability system n=1 Tax=Granulicella mallensis TaxID=940614 RepID=A0A7W7ZRQ2_9BACT|nr:hypothetical protein [Granulicella mallensis]MBB5064884.1 antitoxin (DNA-binding transcriptional repressor) of toxin-antitoxin stability system [Granulicella mallensis]
MDKEGNLVRSVSIQELEEHTAELVAEVEAGNRLTLIRGGKRVADIVPSVDSSEPIWRDEEERLQAIDRVMEKLRRGYDLGGFKITDRDALYDRD